MPSQFNVRPTGPILHITYDTKADEATEACPPEASGVIMAVARALRHLRAVGHRVQWVRPRQRGEAAPGHAVEGRNGDADAGAGATRLRLA